MPVGTCNPASWGQGETLGEFAIEIPLPNGSGSVMAVCRYQWDGTSVKPTCDGDVKHLRTRNTGNVAAWALLPDKKAGLPWVRIDPGTDVTIVAKGQLGNLGLSKASDVESVTLSFTDPAG